MTYYNIVSAYKMIALHRKEGKFRMIAPTSQEKIDVDNQTRTMYWRKLDFLFILRETHVYIHTRFSITHLAEFENRYQQ
jgi:hypothetical protein